MKLIDATNSKVRKQLDALQIIKNAHYLHHIAKVMKTEEKDYKQELSLDSCEEDDDIASVISEEIASEGNIFSSHSKGS